VGSWEVSFNVPHTLAEVDLEKVRSLAAELRNLQLPDGTRLTKVIALTDGLDLVPRVPLNTDGGFFRLLRTRPAALEEQQEMLRELQPEMETSLFNAPAGRMRIVLRSLEHQPAEVKLRLIDAVEAAARKHYPDSNVQTTGLYVLLANLISSLLNDQLVSFGLATLGVAGSMWLAFRSLRIGLISIVPNVLPILLVVGGMSWAGLPINIGTAMIASVSMGLTVDSTIHYLTAYRRRRAAGVSHIEAVKFAHGSVGLALLLANVALVVGFSALSLSNFVPLVYFGVLVSASMVGGLVCNLLLLPVLLNWAVKPTGAGQM
jgi:predicted RND superfamily exporter protein